MPRNRRSYNRYEVHIVGEFKSLSKPDASFLGITRDFSCGGFSFESQFSDLGPGDSLAFKFKHPDRSLVVSTQGEIVWKQHVEKFICLMGVKFRDISASVKNRILKIMAAAGDVPVSLFLTDKDNEDETAMAAQTGQITNNAASCTEPPRGNKIRMAVLMAVTGTIALTIILPAQLDNLFKGITSPGPDPAIITSLQNNENLPSLSVTDNKRQESLIKEIPYHPGSTVSVTDKTGPSGSISGENDRQTAFFIQVGSWKNPEYARDILNRLSEHYPNAYVVIERDFHVIRIPDVMTKTDGDKIIKEIEDTYNLSPLLDLKRKETL